jgi:penicillin-binding protein 1A
MSHTPARQPLAGQRRMSPALRIVAIREAERRRRRTPPPRRAAQAFGVAVGAVLSTTAIALGLVVVLTTSVITIMSADLPEPSALAELDFAQPTVLYDREQKVELGRFQEQRRNVVTFEEIPPLVLDATTTAEDRTFWDNAGVDMQAVMAAMAENAAGGRGCCPRTPSSPARTATCARSRRSSSRCA